MIVSKYLQIVPRTNDYAVYHSLFGNLVLIDSDGMNILETFKAPISISESLAILDNHESSALVAYIYDLRKKNFIVQEGTDEYSLIKYDYNRREQHLQSGYLIRTLQLVMTNTCNFNCEYCFVDSMYNSKERADLQHRSTNMKMSTDIAEQSVRNLLTLLKRNGNKYLHIEFFGGEPLMNWPVIKSVLENFQNGDTYGVRILYSITTNGSFMTESMATIFKRYGVTVTVSFDAPSRIEKSIINKEKGGERVRRNLEILKKKGNWVTFNSVISKGTIEEYDGKALIDIAQYYNIAMIGLILDLDLEFYENEMNKKKVLKELWLTYQYGQMKGVPVVGYWHQVFSQIIGRQPVNLLSGYKTCPATGCKLSVEPERHLFICKCCSGYIGHISDLDHVLTSPEYKKYAMRAYRNAPECEECEIEGFCSGVCMGSLEKKYNKLEVIEKNSCDVFKGITKKFIENVNKNEVEVNYMSTIS